MIKPNFLIATAPGIGPIVQDEIVKKLHVDRKTTKVLRARNDDLVELPFYSDPNRLVSLRIAEDVFQVGFKLSLSGLKSDLVKIKKQAKVFGSRVKNRRVRVVVQARDADWRRYRRVDVQRATEEGLASLPGTKTVSEGGFTEIWLHQVGGTLIGSSRISDASMKHRDYQKVHLEGSLRPAVAAALVLLSDPRDDDVFLDPMTGSGTILIERALAARHRLLLGGDRSDKALAAAKENFGKKHKPWDLKRWDATDLPLETASVDVAVTNPPWGRKVAIDNNAADFYASFMKQLARVVRPSGRIVVLTDQTRALESQIKVLSSKLKQSNHFRDIQVLGHKADIFVLERLAD